MDSAARLRRETLLMFTVIHLVTSFGVTYPHVCPQYCRCESRMKTVTCRGNMFTAVPSHLPRDTRTLQLQGQNFTLLTRVSPVPMRALRDLNLAQDGMFFMSDDALGNLPKLKRLDLSYNYLDRIPVPVSRATSLKELIMHHNRIRTLRAGDFANFTQLKILDLDNNSINYLPFGIFSQLRDLAILYLSNNSISSLSGEMFGNLSKLEELHLTHNKIQTVAFGWLSSVPNTWVLQLGFALAHGHASEASNLFNMGNDVRLPNVEHLVVRGNNISTIPCEHFASLPSLKFLDLSFNSIQVIPRACFSMLRRLEVLQLDNNAITTLEHEAFYNSYNIWTLDLSVNLIRVLPPRAFLGTQLDNLDLSFNELRKFNNRTFIGLEYLTYLSLSGNRIDRLSRSALRPLRSIDILDLRWNYLTRVSNQFCNMTTLTNLALSGNMIESISPEAFQGSFNLKGLYLDNNRLKTVAEETFDLPYLVHVKLYNNPWNCDCGMRWMREAMFSDSSLHTWMLYTDAEGVDSYKGIMCVSPQAFANVSVFMIKETDIFRLICSTYVSPLAIEFIVGISFAIIASSTLCYVAKLYCKVRDLDRTGADTAKCLS